MGRIRLLCMVNLTRRPHVPDGLREWADVDYGPADYDTLRSQSGRLSPAPAWPVLPAP